MAEVEPIYIRVGEATCELRLQRGWSHSYVAEKLGLTRTSVVNIEAGRQRIMLHQLEVLADLFGVSVGRFTSAPEEPQSEIIKRLRLQNAKLRGERDNLKISLHDVAARAQTAIRALAE